MTSRAPGRANRVVPDAEYDAFYSKQTPLDHHIVWIGKTDPRVDNLVVAMRKGRVRSIQADTHPDLVRILQEAMSNGQWIYAFTFSIGFVVFQVMGHYIPAALNVGPDHFRVLDRIWPVQGDIVWPSKDSVITLGHLDNLHELIAGVTPP